MLYWIIQATIISFILIFLVHYLFDFFKSTLTVPKIKDLVYSPHEKYNDIFKVINNSSINSSLNPSINSNSKSNSDYTLIDLLPNSDNNTLNTNTNSNTMNQNNLPSMKNELKNFLKKQLHNSTPKNLYEMDTNSNTNLSYSNF